MAEESYTDYIEAVDTAYGTTPDRSSSPEIPASTSVTEITNIPLSDLDEDTAGTNIVEFPPKFVVNPPIKIYSTIIFRSPKVTRTFNTGTNENLMHKRVSTSYLNNNLLGFRYFPKMVHIKTNTS